MSTFESPARSETMRNAHLFIESEIYKYRTRTGNYSTTMSSGPFHDISIIRILECHYRVLLHKLFCFTKSSAPARETTLPRCLQVHALSVLQVLRAPNIGGHRKLFCTKAMLPFGSDQALLYARGRETFTFAILRRKPQGFYSLFSHIWRK